MKVNWKALVRTTGYLSLKAAYKKDTGRDKQERLRLFNWVISRAKHYACKTGRSLASILTEWEVSRDYWWMNYYNEYNQPKLHANSLKPVGVKGTRKYYKRWHHYSDASRKKRVTQFIQGEQAEASTKEKKRWNMRKKRMRRY